MGERNQFGFTEEEMESMTEAERAAIMDEDTLEPEDVIGLAAAEGDKPAVPEEGAAAEPEAKKPEEAADDDTDTDPPEVDPGAEPEAAKEEPKPADPPEADKQPEAKVPAPRQNAVPRYDVPADAGDKLKAFDQQLDDIAAKFDDGEMTMSEARQQQREIERQRDELKELMLRQKVATDFSVSNWTDKEVPAFLADHPEYAPGTLRYKLLDAAVREEQNANPDNPFDPDHLTRAHARIAAELAGTAPAKQEPQPAAAGLAAQKPAPRTIPPTLKDIPQADISAAGDGGKYAVLDRLLQSDPEAYEEAVAKMSDEEREAYLQAGA